MAKAFGRDPQEAAQVKGLEIPMHDPRAFHGQAVTYATGPRGACSGGGGPTLRVWMCAGWPIPPNPHRAFRESMPSNQDQSRGRFIAGNWKMYKTLEEARALA
mgnify:CR=1 FL=1